MRPANAGPPLHNSAAVLAARARQSRPRGAGQKSRKWQKEIMKRDFPIAIYTTRNPYAGDGSDPHEVGYTQGQV